MTIRFDQLRVACDGTSMKTHAAMRPLCFCEARRMPLAYPMDRVRICDESFAP